jgi:glycosyltransferase involved in cell wall biosynthesis
MKTVGIHRTYPDTTGDRRAEGGMRVQGVSRPDDGAPLVTILTVCFNSAATIAQTIASIRAQTYQPIEYLVIDGGSTDGTVDLLQANADIIDYFVSEPDKGLYHAMNKGLSLASGQFILILNSDDWYEPDTVERLVRAQGFSGCDVVGGLARYVNADGSTSVLPGMRFDHATLLRMPLRHQTMLIPAVLYDALGGYDTRYPIIADFDLTIRLYRAGKTYFEIGAPLLNFRTTGVSSTALDRLHNEHRALLREVFPFLSDAEVQTLGDHSTARPADFIAAARAHLDQPDFVLAVRDLLRDFGRLWGGVWSGAPVDDIAAGARDLFPSISVIIPVHNAAAHIDATVHSALSQSLRDIEVICVNDCSTDDSVDRIARIAARDTRVRLIDNPINLGPGGSRNRGIRAASGDYVFFLDADDMLPPGALLRLLDVARRNGSDMVRGAFRVNRRIHGEEISTIKSPCGFGGRTVESTTFAQMPELLETTEGHWACLYDRSFVETVLYPEGLRMGEDSLFLIRAHACARTISVIPDIVYVYQDSATSLMNTVSYQKCLHELDWRKRAWGVLDIAGATEQANHILFDYWNPPFFTELDRTLSTDEAETFYRRLRDTFAFAGGRVAEHCHTPALRDIFLHNFARFDLVETAPARRRNALHIAMLSSTDSGGAGIASQRCMQALRDAGQDAFSVCIFRKTKGSHVFFAPLTPEASTLQHSGAVADLWAHWMASSTLTRDSTPASRARELFSRPDSLVDAIDLKRTVDKVDIVHLHWVVGMLDYPRLPEMLGDKPVVWTLHDMNAFTGGCHYSQGCEKYRDSCDDCPLLEEGATLAHEAWALKKAAYDQIPNLHIVCPSQWLADCVASSSLLGGRPVHVIPNFLPVDKFVPTAKMIARLKLGLPLDRTYIAFGADSLRNERKGGHVLKQALAHLKTRGEAAGIEGLFFGAADLDIGIPSHNLGYISDPAELSLVYAAADVFAFPSLEDNAPQTVVEALLSGTPVVGFPVGNVPDLVAHLDTGYIARYGDSQDFATGLSWILDDCHGAAAKLRGLRSQLIARDHHDPASVLRQHLALFKSLVE